ncbi:MAG: hypothetical protein JRJ85_22000 [Deltaproteobacteria bacterium]|nr:hypothetical protein [Deltaproteobacteria bacterium]
MRSLLIDEIMSSDMEKIVSFLKKNTMASDLPDIFWVRIPDDLLSAAQYQHPQCQPHVFAIELSRDKIKLEFFIRSLKGFNCLCNGYCTIQQRDFIFNFAQNMIDRLSLKT